MRYLGQKDDFNCGPIAIINVLKYFNYDVDETHIPKIGRKCGTNPVMGTQCRPIIKYLRDKGLDARERRCITIQKVLDGINEGIWILCGDGFGDEDDEYAHWFVMTEYDAVNKQCKLINFYCSYPSKWISLRELKKVLLVSPAIYIKKD